MTMESEHIMIKILFEVRIEVSLKISAMPFYGIGLAWRPASSRRQELRVLKADDTTHHRQLNHQSLSSHSLSLFANIIASSFSSLYYQYCLEMDSLVAQYTRPLYEDEGYSSDEQNELSCTTPSLSLKFAMPPVARVSVP
jgi:hypothetical protein